MMNSEMNKIAGLVLIFFCLLFRVGQAADSLSCNDDRLRVAPRLLAQDIIHHFTNRQSQFLAARLSEHVVAGDQRVEGLERFRDPGNPKPLKFAGLKDGDVIFLGLESRLYSYVAASTNSWVSHVGVAMSERSANEWVVYESVPLKGASRPTPLVTFLAKAKGLRIAIARAKRSWPKSSTETLRQCLLVNQQKWYHLGFKYDSNYQYCSKLVYDCYKSLGTGYQLGQIQKFEEIADRFVPNTEFTKGFTREQLTCFWESYFSLCRSPALGYLCKSFGGDDPEVIAGEGGIPRNRAAISPANQYKDALDGNRDFTIVFDSKPWLKVYPMDEFVREDETNPR